MLFWPTGYLTTTSMVIIFALSFSFLIWGNREQRCIAIALLASWVGARLATKYESHWFAAAGMFIGAAAAYYGITRISRSIAILYAMRLALLSLVGIGYGWFVFWEMNRVFLYLQILLAIGTLWTDGTSRRILDNGSHRSVSGPGGLHMPSLWRSILGRIRSNHQVR